MLVGPRTIRLNKVVLILWEYIYMSIVLVSVTLSFVLKLPSLVFLEPITLLTLLFWHLWWLILLNPFRNPFCKERVADSSIDWNLTLRKGLFPLILRQCNKLVKGMGCRPGFKFHLCPVELDVVADSVGSEMDCLMT